MCGTIRDYFPKLQFHPDARVRATNGDLIFDCLIHVEFWCDGFEIPIRAGLLNFFLGLLFTEPESILHTGGWLDSIMAFLRYAILAGSPDLLMPVFAEFPLSNFILALANSWGIPRGHPILTLCDYLENHPSQRQRVHAQLCAIVSRAMQVNPEFASELNAEHFFRDLIGRYEDGNYFFRIETGYMLSIAFQLLATSDLCDFMVPEFVEILEIVDAGDFLDGRDLKSEVARAILRMNSILPQDDELREVLLQVIPLETIEGLGQLAA
jgi:hypothetical protein